MKKLLKPTKYIFSMMSLVTIIYFKISPDNFNPVRHFSAVLRKITATNPASLKLEGVPCGFKTVDILEPRKPSFFTSNDVPVLQYPAGNSPGTNFQIPDAIYSASQSDQLILQADGNLVLYCTTTGKALWSTQTNGKGGKTLFFQTDGDLVLHNASGKVIWHSNIKSTCTGSELAYFTLQDDGNLGMFYDESVNNKAVAAYLGGTATTNDQAASPHPGKIF